MQNLFRTYANRREAQFVVVATEDVEADFALFQDQSRQDAQIDHQQTVVARPRVVAVDNNGVVAPDLENASDASDIRQPEIKESALVGVERMKTELGSDVEIAIRRLETVKQFREVDGIRVEESSGGEEAEHYGGGIARSEDDIKAEYVILRGWDVDCRECVVGDCRTRGARDVVDLDIGVGDIIHSKRYMKDEVAVANLAGDVFDGYQDVGWDGDVRVVAGNGLDGECR